MIEDIIRKQYPAFDTSPISSIRTSPDPVVRGAILWEYGILPLLPFATDPLLIDRQANDFIRLRGTQKSIRMALSWVGFPSITFKRLTKNTFEVDPGRIPTELEIKAIRAALAVSVQARGILTRIYNGNFEVRYG